MIRLIMNVSRREGLVPLHWILHRRNIYTYRVTLCMAMCIQVTVTPASKLTFTVLPNKSIRATLTLTNEGNSPHVAFKVKTTQPKR